ncbi:MAG: endonuclease/exonuclease/phosphatase family protein [Parcubacteria group bacterium]
MKLISLNVGIKIDNNDKAAAFLVEQDADILCLQEVVRHFDEGVLPQFQSKKAIDDAVAGRYPYRFFGPQWISKGLDRSGGRHQDFGGFIEQDNYILSKFPLVAAENQHYQYHYRLEIDHTRFAETDHPRSVVVATPDVHGTKLTVLNVHGCWSKEKGDMERSLKQSEYFIETAKNIANPLLLVGDFNVAPNTKSISMLNDVFENMIEKYGIASTLPNARGNLETAMLVDYIFTNKGIASQSLKVIETDISDHLPLMFEFNFDRARST